MFYSCFLGVLLLLRAGLTASAAPDICNVPGQCSNEFLGFRFAESLESCIIQGKQIEGAQFVSWKPTPTGPCEVFAECEIADSINAVTSSVDCEVCGAAGLCSGHIEVEAEVAGDYECEQLCLETPTCDWFTHLEHQYCLIFADCPSFTTECTNCFTSMRSCLEETSTTPSTTTPTTSPKTSAPTALNKILYIDGETGKTTLVSLDGTTANCDLEDYPAPSNYPAAVTYNNGEVLACGGRDLEDADRCWSFNGSAWSALPNSKQKHCYFDSPNVIVNEEWWITGQLQTRDDSCSGSSSTSDVYTSSNWKPGPALPGDEYPAYSCVVNLNKTHTFLIGGGDPVRRDAWLYDWTSQAWTRTGSLIQGRRAQGCVALDGERILVAGGYDGGDVYTVELYDPTQGTWSSQPDLPADINPAAPLLLNWDDQVLALFNNEDQIYQRSEETGEWSVLAGVQLPETFSGYLYDKAILVPGSWSCNPAQ